MVAMRFVSTYPFWFTECCKGSKMSLLSIWLCTIYAEILASENFQTIGVSHYYILATLDSSPMPIGCIKIKSKLGTDK